MKRTTGLIVFVGLLLFGAADNKFICPKSKEAARGENVTMICQLEPQRDVTKEELLKLEFNESLNVLVCRDVDDCEEILKDKQFKSRSSLNRSGLTNGTFNVTLSNVTEADAGRYSCSVGKRETHDSCSFNLTINAGKSHSVAPKVRVISKSPDRNGSAVSSLSLALLLVTSMLMYFW